jgi:predicted nucleic acid-binding Zn ribbon protein
VSSIREIIRNIVNKLADKDGFKRAWVEKHWPELVGVEASRHSLPQRVERAVLFVNVDSSVWNQELFMRRRQLLQKINGSFSHVILNDVKYQIGHFSFSQEPRRIKGKRFPGWSITGLGRIGGGRLIFRK